MLNGLEQVVGFFNDANVFEAGDIEAVRQNFTTRTFDGTDFSVYPTSLDRAGGNLCFMVNQGGVRMFVSLGSNDDGFQAAETQRVGEYTAKICGLSCENAAVLRQSFDYTNPQVLGTEPAFGTGDRIGGMASATPGHVRAAMEYHVAMFFAQQSVRENERTGRTFQQVLDDACWGVFQEGYRQPWGADADHLMEFSDMEAAIDAGFTMFTVDPSHHINNDAAVRMGEAAVCKEFYNIFGGDAPQGNRFARKYTSLRETLKDGGYGLWIGFSEMEVMRLTLQYLNAIEHTQLAYKHIAQRLGHTDFDFEMSIDETDMHTTAQAHYFIARELRDREVIVTSIAPRYRAGFEKGVDIRAEDGGQLSRCDLVPFEDSLRAHAIIARAMGPYKLCLHSGSDKFSAYPIVSRHTQGMFHVKTAGTSYLEALKVVAVHDKALFTEMYGVALETFEQNRASYHLTTNLDNVPEFNAIAKMGSDQLVGMLKDNDHARQVMHVAYGPLLDKFRDRMFGVLTAYSEDHYKIVSLHMGNHMRTFGLKEKG